MKTYDELAFKYCTSIKNVAKVVSMKNIPHSRELICGKSFAVVGEEGEKMLDALLLKPPLTLSFKNYVRPDIPQPRKKFTPGARIFVMGR